jgi:hypothetical protein
MQVAGVLNDLFQYDTLNMQWSELNASLVRGVFPSPRRGLGFTAASGRLYAFAGAYPSNTSTNSTVNLTCTLKYVGFIKTLEMNKDICLYFKSSLFLPPSLHFLALRLFRTLSVCISSLIVLSLTFCLSMSHYLSSGVS